MVHSDGKAIYFSTDLSLTMKQSIQIWVSYVHDFVDWPVVMRPQLYLASSHAHLSASD